VTAAGHVGRLLDAGCLDRRLDRLAAQAQAWLPAVQATVDLPGVDAATWLSPEEEAGLRAAVPRLQARCAELAGHAVPPSIVHGDLHLSNVAGGPGGYLFFDWTDACVAHPFLDLATIRRGTAFVDSADEAELRERAPPGLPARVGLVRVARAPGPGLGAGRPAGRPAPGGQLPVAGRPAAGGPPHGPVDRLVAAPGAGRPGVTDGTRRRCRRAQPGRGAAPQTDGGCT
jgi:Phosphotransferase enzyme family